MIPAETGAGIGEVHDHGRDPGFVVCLHVQIVFFNRRRVDVDAIA